MTYTQELKKALEDTKVVKLEDGLPPANWMMAFSLIREAARLYLEQLR